MIKNSHVVITHAPQNNYTKDYVALPKNYGSDKYYSREDVINIKQTVFKNLDDLDKKIKFSDQIRGKKVLIKPNLVTPFYKSGLKDDEYPETTDPRVLEAVIAYIYKYTKDIVIVESSGRGLPTSASFDITGIDRIAKHYNIKCIALEEQPVDRYMLPKAQVMKEIYIPRIFSEVVRGEAFYISVPKMKTNLYTGVTLGFKNAMGTIPYNLRQRNHNYHINKKLVDMLFLFKPDLVVIDGIIGGEGNTPAPVDPVKTHVIISGNNSVETDRVTTRMMGIDPDSIDLMIEAQRMGFGDDNVTVIGEERVTPFRKADQSLLSDYFISQFPNVKFLVGHDLNNAPKIDSINSVTPELVKEIEKACIGGCLASIRFGFEMFYYQGLNNDFELAVILGSGVTVGDKRYFFDRYGAAYTKDDIRNLQMKKLAFGSCTKDLKDVVDIYAEGCMPKPAEGMDIIHKLTKQPNKIRSLKNKMLFKVLKYTLSTKRKRIKLVKSGEWIDCLPSHFDDRIHEIPKLSNEDKNKDYIEWPLPKLEGKDKEIFLKDI